MNGNGTPLIKHNETKEDTEEGTFTGLIPLTISCETISTKDGMVQLMYMYSLLLDELTGPIQMTIRQVIEKVDRVIYISC